MNATTDLPAWALAEYERHAREAAAALRRIAQDDEWLRLWQTYIKAARHDNAFTRWYMGILAASMARLDVERERE